MKNKLPTTLKISLYEMGIDERIGDYITDMYGMCLNGFNFEIKNNEVIVTNIDWDEED